MWSVVFLAPEACRQQRTEHFLAGLWESPLTVLSLPLIKNVFYDLLLSRPVCPPRRFSLRKSLNPCSAPPPWPSVSPCRNVRAKQADTLFSLRYKNITNPLRYFYSPGTSADRLSKFTSHYTEITCTWWVCWLISNSNKKYSCICIMNLCEYIFCNSNTVNAFVKKNSYIFLLFPFFVAFMQLVGHLVCPVQFIHYRQLLSLGDAS